MTDIIDAASLPPVSEAAPCGPDLDAEGDAEYMNFMAATEGQLPAAYFSFDRKSVDLPAAIASGEKLLARSHDVRLLVLVAKLAILDRDIGAFARWLAIATRLLADHWDDVHPRAEGGDFTARVAQLSTLNDLPVVVLPLQYAPLAETQRDGVLNFRAQLLALGEVGARDSENLPNAAAIERILLNADMAQLGETLKALQTIKSSIAEMSAILVERVGFVDALKFEVLSPLVERMTAFIHEALARRDPKSGARRQSRGDGGRGRGRDGIARARGVLLVRRRRRGARGGPRLFPEQRAVERGRPADRPGASAPGKEPL